MGEARQKRLAGAAAAIPAVIKKCRGCGKDLTSATDSEAHIIPNALGGRLKPKGIICRSCNGKLDELADNALVRAFGHWPTLLNLPRDRGEQPRKLIETQNGKRVWVESDGSITLADPDYKVAPVEAGHEVMIAAGNMKTFRQLLQKVAKEFPGFDPALAEQHARTVGIEQEDALKMDLDFSPPMVLGGVVTAGWLYLIEKTGRAFMEWDRLVQAISEVQSHAGNFRYYTDGLPGLRGPDIGLGHKLVVRSIRSTGELIAYVELLGVVQIGGLFAKASRLPATEIEHIYAYDLIQQADRSREFSIDREVFRKQNWDEVGLAPTETQALRDHYRDALTVLERFYRDRFRAPDVKS
jgi:hypothetical protein